MKQKIFILLISASLFVSCCGQKEVSEEDKKEITDLYAQVHSLTNEVSKRDSIIAVRDTTISYLLKINENCDKALLTIIREKENARNKSK